MIIARSGNFLRISDLNIGWRPKNSGFEGRFGRTKESLDLPTKRAPSVVNALQLIERILQWASQAQRAWRAGDH
jgi:hypothetical protein